MYLVSTPHVHMSVFHGTVVMLLLFECQLEWRTIQSLIGKSSSFSAMNHQQARTVNSRAKVSASIVFHIGRGHFIGLPHRENKLCIMSLHICCPPSLSLEKLLGDVVSLLCFTNP